VARAGLELTLGLRVQQSFVRLLAGLPPGWQVRLSGKRPVVVDGDTLAPEVQLTLALLERRGEPSPETLSPTEARRVRRRLTAVYAGKPVAVGLVEEVEIDASVPLRGRHYAPSEPGGPQPLLVYYHGGGFTYGDLDTHDGVCRILCRHAGAHVLAVDYRLAPEHPFPAAVQDAHASFDPLRDEGEDYANALRKAGTPVMLRRFPGFTHAFIAAAGVSRPSRDALVEIAGATRAMFATEHQRTNSDSP
jgi:acetyl esterase/lipase